ncbi:cytosine permease [Streptomyces sp. NBC_01306]|uniref:purine-cytosine permease family protein n=1 Tax=Streptomyces sp. NBC_01306 TaxID=2903819 RepID=UPI0022566E4C|nr:cytosine permease [Streptomyces sp. NBC_01306]MCX4729022.1 cytosine permease [Streptomyces sp. NBC_01306]
MMKGHPSFALERRTIEHIPATERHGRPWHQLALWFSTNVQINTLITGAVTIGMGLDLTWAVISIVVGNLVGGLFMAYHSAQGPQLGLPQMVQSRAQFGLYGAVLPSAMVVLMYLGFAVEGSLVAGQAIAAWAHVPKTVGIVVFNLVLLMIPLVGYRLIHAAGRVVAVISGVAFLALFVRLLPQLSSHPSGATTHSVGAVVSAISVCVAWQVTWAPYVSDYSRYLPADTPTRVTFAYTYLGSAVGGAGTMIVGAMAATVNSAAVNSDAIGFLAGRFPSVSGLLVVALLIGLVPAGAEGPYGAFLTAVSALSAEGRVRSTAAARAFFVICFAVVASALAIVSSGSLLTTFQNITLFVLYLLVPWTAINLTDYYVVRRGHYDIPALLTKNGRYGTFTWWAVLIYFVSIAVELPFINSSVYVGPLVASLGGADVSWLVGLVVGGGGYYACAKLIRDRRIEPVVQPS